MKCPLCGKETQPGNNCSECGADISKYNKGGGLFGEGYTPSSTKISEPSDESKKQNKNTIFGIVFVAVIIVAVVALLFSCNNGKNAPAPKNTSAAETTRYQIKTEPRTEKPTEEITEEQTEEITEKPTEPPTEKPTEPPTEALTEAKNETVIFNNMGIVITYTGISYSIFGTEVNLRIENNSGHDYTFQVRDVSVNNYMLDPVFSCDVKNGKTANSEMDFLNSTLEKNAITEFKSIELSIHAFNWDDPTYDFDSEMISFNP